MSFPTQHMNGTTRLSTQPKLNSQQVRQLPPKMQQMMTMKPHGGHTRSSYNVDGLDMNSAVKIQILPEQKSIFDDNSNGIMNYTSSQALASALFPISDNAHDSKLQDMHTGLVNHTENIQNLNDFASKHYNMTQDALKMHDTGLLHHTEVLQKQHTGLSNHRDVLSKQHTALLQHKELLEKQTAHVNSLLESDAIKHTGLQNHTDALNHFKMGLKTHANQLNDQHLGLLNHQTALQNIQQTQAKSASLLQEQDTGLIHHTEALNLQHTGLLNHQQHIREQQQLSEMHTEALNDHDVGLKNHTEVLRSNQETLRQLATQLQVHNSGLEELHVSTQAGLSSHKHTLDTLNSNQQMLAKSVNDLKLDLANLQKATSSQNNASNNLQLETLSKQTQELKNVVTNNANILKSLINQSTANANNDMHQLMQRAPRMSR